MKFRRHILWILVLFIVSVAVRIPTLNRPLSKHHEFVTAHVLRIMTIWKEDGLVKNNFNPIMNYRGEANKFINNQSLGDFDKNGNDFYESYPPFAYLFPYLIFQLLNIPIAPLPLELFNLLLHLAEAFLLYEISCLLFKWNGRENIFLPGIIAVAMHLFNPCTLWFHSNVYMTDMLAVTLWLFVTFLFLKIEEKEKLSSASWLSLLFIANFFLNYTEYLGVTFTIVAVLYCFFNFRKNKNYLGVAAVLGLSCLAAIALTVYQYSRINGLPSLWEIVQYRYSIKSGYQLHGGTTQRILMIAGQWKAIAINYIIGFLPELLLLIVLLVLLLSTKEIRHNFISSPFKRTIIFLLLPVFLHHAIFLNASALDFFVLKSSPFIALFIAGIFYQLILNQRIAQQNMIAVTSLTVVAGILIYYYINRPGEISLSGELYDKYKMSGNFIQHEARPDEVVFIQHILDEPQLVYYAHRNLRTIKNEEKAVQFLQTYRRRKGIIFAEDSTQTIHLLKRIELPE